MSFLEKVEIFFLRNNNNIFLFFYGHLSIFVQPFKEIGISKINNYNKN